MVGLRWMMEDTWPGDESFFFFFLIESVACLVILQPRLQMQLVSAAACVSQILIIFQTPTDAN